MIGEKRKLFFERPGLIGGESGSGEGIALAAANHDTINFIWEAETQT